mmetsp:Transcript_6832/g.12980  ORF Transcript_6832/g.12980 Transcript_6832/m.12980 type:complete len:80 (-) Transcript_6832:4683-4922(-)
MFLPSLSGDASHYMQPVLPGNTYNLKQHNMQDTWMMEEKNCFESNMGTISNPLQLNPTSFFSTCSSMASSQNLYPSQEI